MTLSFLLKPNNLPLEKRNQRLVRQLLFLFAFTLENKHHSTIQIQFNNLELTVKPTERFDMSKDFDMKQNIDHPTDLGVTLKIEGYLTDVFTRNVDEKIKKKINKIMKKNQVFYHIEQVEGSTCSIQTIHK